MAETVRPTFLQSGFILAISTQGANTINSLKGEFLNIFSIGFCYQSLSLLSFLVAQRHSFFVIPKV